MNRAGHQWGKALLGQSPSGHQAWGQGMLTALSVQSVLQWTNNGGPLGNQWCHLSSALPPLHYVPANTQPQPWQNKACFHSHGSQTLLLTFYMKGKFGFLLSARPSSLLWEQLLLHFFPLKVLYTHTHRCTNLKSERCSIFKSKCTRMTLIQIEIEHLQHPRKCPFSKGHCRNTPPPKVTAILTV